MLQFLLLHLSQVNPLISSQYNYQKLNSHEVAVAVAAPLAAPVIGAALAKRYDGDDECLLAVKRGEKSGRGPGKC